MPRVLVIDDSRATRVHLSSILEKAGWDVVAEEDGERGAAAALTSPPDVVISDLWMPGLSGLQLCRLLHEDPATARVPIVLMSASLDRRSKFWAQQSGASLTLDKKLLTGDMVHQTLSNLVDQAGITRPPGPPQEVSPKAIPMRLSHQLDRALFESVVAKELRSLAIAPHIAAFFSGLVDLLGRILAFRWLALTTIRGEGEDAWIHTHPQESSDSVADASAILRPSGEVNLTCDERGQQEPSPKASNSAKGESMLLGIDIGGAALGRLAIRGYDPKFSAADRQLLDLVRAELSHALRAVLLVEETRRLASTDTLTELWNRRQGTEILEQSLSGAKRYGHALSVAMIDIDFFKKVNDTYGHHAGDLALKHVAQIIRRTCRKADGVARWGGEEFLVIMPFTGTAGARVAGERVRAAVATKPVIIENDRQIPISVSIGVATDSPEQRDDPLVSRADRALYLAKSRGRNRVEVG